jgi:hypothetical protein
VLASLRHRSGKVGAGDRPSGPVPVISTHLRQAGRCQPYARVQA